MEAPERPLRICRTCLKPIVVGTACHDLDSFEPKTELIKLQHKLIRCVPELNLGLATSMVVCGNCFAAINSAYSFKARCLQTEMEIHKYLLQVGCTSSVDLSKIVPNQIQLEATKEINMRVEAEASSNGFASEHFTSVFIKEDRDAQQERFLQQQNDILPFEAVDNDFMLSRTNIAPSEFAFENVKDEPFISLDMLYRDSREDCNNTQVVDANCKCRCGFRCVNRNELNVHLKNHKKNIRLWKGELRKQHYSNFKIYKCFLCRYLCKHKALLFVHMRTHLTKVMYRQVQKHAHWSCNVGSNNLQFKSKEQQQRNFKNNRKPLFHHRSKKSRFKKFKCTDCQYSSNNKFNQYAHIRTHFPVKTQRANKRIVLKQHTQPYMPNRNNLQNHKIFKCSQCSYKSNQKGNLKNHMIVHSKEKPFQCAHCDFRSAYKSSFERHMKIHTGEMPYKCTQCDYKTVNKGHLDDHIKVHAGEKPFKCDRCDFKTVYKSNFKKHVIIHTGELPFICSQCQYRTTNKCHLINHSRIHTGEKPFKCTHCNFRTAHKSNYRSHVNLHTGENLFRCAQCSYKTARRGYFENHLRTHAAEKWLS